MWGVEEHIKKMETYQKAGEYLVYKKPNDEECPYRLAIIKVMSITDDLKNVTTKKLRLIVKTDKDTEGMRIAYKNNTKQWFDNIEELIHFYKHKSDLGLDTNYMTRLKEGNHNILVPISVHCILIYGVLNANHW